MKKFLSLLLAIMLIACTSYSQTSKNPIATGYQNRVFNLDSMGIASNVGYEITTNEAILDGNLYKVYRNTNPKNKNYGKYFIFRINKDGGKYRKYLQLN